MAVDKMTLRVRVTRINNFWRYNRFNHRRELVFCIGMIDVAGESSDEYVTFTSGAFSEVKEGEEYTIECRFKKYNVYNGRQQQIVTHCKCL